MRIYLTATGLTAVLIVLFILLSSPIATIENQALDTKFRLRSETHIDSNVVVILLDGDDIDALGGWPLKRSYYALLINALDNLGAKVIGLDIFFEEPNPLYAESDSLLVRMASKQKNVVFASYFQEIAMKNAPPSPKDSLGENFGFEVKKPTSFQTARALRLPYPAIQRVAAGLGQTNLPDESVIRSVPLILQCGGRLYPSISLEIARLFLGVTREQVLVHGRDVRLDDRAKPIPISSDGSLGLNYRGGISSLNRFHFLDFLKSYDLYRTGFLPRVPVTRVKGKAVIVGVVAPGVGKFFTTPYSSTFPAVGVDATALDNIITGQFLTVSPPLVRHLVSGFFMFAPFLLVYRLQGSVGVAAAAGLFALYLVINLLSFLFLSLSLPAFQPFAAIIVAMMSALVLKQKHVRTQLAAAESNKDKIEKELLEKEKKLQELDTELRLTRQGLTHRNERVLQEQMRKYREDIRTLSSQAGDFSPYEAFPEGGEVERGEFENLVYCKSGKMTDIVKLIEKVAPSDANIFISGESGTGKELIARAIHARSKRKERPFVPVNCGALTESLLESELFGHERGAFTGAVKEKAGRFELANGGTIFLDEITETSEAFQVKLLRVLQSGEFERVGGTNTLKVDVRVLAATNKDIKEALRQRGFREDLYYRLSVFTIQLPPLRERKADITFLVEEFLAREGDMLKLSSTVMDALLGYDWKGNARELESVIKRAAILARAESRNLIRVKDLPEEIASGLQKKAEIEDQILLLLREKGFSRSAISETAEDLGHVNRGTVAEYFRGMCFKTFFEQGFDLKRSASILAGTDDATTVERVVKKILEYLSNAFESFDRTRDIEELKSALLPKYKNLPQRYHLYLDQLIETHWSGRWTLPSAGPKP
jgi:transcriptional regulator with GAF, ATPase, and Fis domain/CHASE2 domain-containing sensor protein